jgi:hypothetical protein
MTIESNQAESDIELSSDESRCLDDIDAVLSPIKTNSSAFLYANDLWHTTPLTNTTNHTLNDANNNPDNDPQQQQQQQQQQQMITLKSVCNEPLSPVPALVHNVDGTKTVATIHRRPMLIAYTDSEACSPTRPTHFRCTQCHETFDSLLLGQEHANRGMCTPDAAVHVGYSMSDCRISFSTMIIH